MYNAFSVAFLNTLKPICLLDIFTRFFLTFTFTFYLFAIIKSYFSEIQRNVNEVYVDHYISKEIGVAKRMVSFLLSNKNKNFLDLSTFLHVSEYIKKDQVQPLFNNRLFKKNAKVVGPIEKNKKYHVFNIVESYEEGSFIGLDLVYDEIYQRLYKKEEIIKKNILINKLRKEVNIYINPEYNIK